MNPRYKELLGKYYADDELRELLDLLRLDVARREMIHYHKEGRYPEKADLIDMLIMDMLTVEEFYKKAR